MLAPQPVDHPTDGVACRAVQVRADAVGPVPPPDRGRHLGGEELRTGHVHVLAHGQPDQRPHRCLDRGPTDLAVTLGRVAVAHRHARALVIDGQEERRSGSQMARVHVPAVEVGRDGRARPVDRRDPDLATERHDRDANTGQELGTLTGPRDLRDPEIRIGELVGQQTEPWDVRGPAPVGRFELEEVDLEGIARLGAHDGDRAVDLVDPVEVELTELFDRRRRRELTARGIEQIELDDRPAVDRFDGGDRRIPCEVISIARDVDRRCRGHHRTLSYRRRRPPPGPMPLRGWGRRVRRAGSRT